MNGDVSGRSGSKAVSERAVRAAASRAPETDYSAALCELQMSKDAASCHVYSNLQMLLILHPNLLYQL